MRVFIELLILVTFCAGLTGLGFMAERITGKPVMVVTVPLGIVAAIFAALVFIVTRNQLPELGP